MASLSHEKKQSDTLHRRRARAATETGTQQKHRSESSFKIENCVKEDGRIITGNYSGTTGDITGDGKPLAEEISALLKDAPRSGRIPRLPEEKEKEIIEATLHRTPADATHWSVKTMAEAQKISRMAVHRLWKKYNIKLHKVKTFKISNDPNFVEKVKDVVGFYLNPPDRTLVLSVDEKSQIQVLDRTQPGLPMKRGYAGTMTHNYKRHGMTTLFAALNILDGKVSSACMQKHRQMSS